MRGRVVSGVVCLAALAGMTGGRLSAQAPSTTGLTYLTPIWSAMVSASPEEMAAQAALLRSRVGENATVKVGFATYLVVTIDDWPATSPAAIRAVLGTFEAQLDSAIARAQSQNLALVVTLLTPIRERVDQAQTTSFAEDRRVMQWYSDQTVATGWWTHSRYARRQYEVREAYMREVAKIFAARIAAHPQTLVGVAGDGEVELSNARIDEAGGPVLADYSPFAVAEFRDWLRGAGLYAPGQPFEGEAYARAARYAGDTTPNDTSGDGVSFNSDFGTAFTSWSLRYFDWSLTDAIAADANAIPAALYSAPAFSATPAGNATGFDAPRTRDTSAWWQIWARFRETMIWRHNRDLARWMTTTVNAAGQSVPVDRWFSYQIPTDYMFNHTPDDPDARYITSASAWWTANVYPYGGMGFTSFGTNQGSGAVARTLPGLLGAIRPCASGVTGPTCIETPGGLGSQPWGIFEWNPVVPGLTDPQVYLDEIRRLRKYRPRILAPYAWGYADHPVLDSGFEPALRQLVTLLADGWAPALTVNRATLAMAATRSGASILSQTVAQPVAVGQPTGGTVDWSATANQVWVRIASGTGHGDGEFTVALVPEALAALAGGTHTATVTVAAPGSVQGTRTVTVTLSIVDAAQTAPPIGNLDSPVEGAPGLSGAIAVTGWALDDVGVERVEIWRNCLAPIDSNRPGVCRPVTPTGAADRVFIGHAAFLPGARTDIETNPQYAGYPLAYRAGWGYLLLTNALPNQASGATEGGQGPVTLYAYAVDREGRYTELGARTIALDNDNATRPFGSIDTPEQGGTVAATLMANFGWAMTQTGKCIDTANAASYRVFIDGVSRTLTPGVNWIPGLARTDLAAAYPGLCNSGNALAAYYLNVATLGLANGLHTIGWDVYDDNGTPLILADDNVAGIGSRFFTVQVSAADAPVSDRPARRGDAVSLAAWPPAPDRVVRARVGAVESPVVAVAAGADGVRRVNLPAGSRLVMDLGGPVRAGYLVAGTELRDLPVGSTLDAEQGQFYWQPPAPYFGAFTLAFIGAAHGGLARMDVTVTIVDPSAAGEPVITIASPKPGANPNPVITVAGTAVDPRAVTGTGIAAIHVWARPLDGEKTPDVFFVGTGSIDGERYSLTTVPLLPGTYQIEVYAWVARIGTWAPAATVTIAVR